MMDTKLRDFAPLPNVSLEELVPKDNFYRRWTRRCSNLRSSGNW
jgi:hypothetical protein